MALSRVPTEFLYAQEAAQDLTTSLNLMAAIQEGTGKIRLASNTGERAFGAIVEVPLSASVPYGPATVQFGGIAKVKAGAAVQPGAELSVDSAGRVVTAGAAAKVGMALEAAGAANEVIAVKLY